MSELQRGRVEFSDPTQAAFGHQRAQPIIPPARAPVVCPICKGVTTMPTSFYEPVTGSVNKREKCRSCNGRGIV